MNWTATTENIPKLDSKANSKCILSTRDTHTVKWHKCFKIMVKVYQEKKSRDIDISRKEK